MAHSVSENHGRLPNKELGKHRWIALVTYTLTERAVEAAFSPKGGAFLDDENRITVMVGCYDCEQPYGGVVGLDSLCPATDVDPVTGALGCALLATLIVLDVAIWGCTIAALVTGSLTLVISAASIVAAASALAVGLTIASRRRLPTRSSG